MSGRYIVVDHEESKTYKCETYNDVLDAIDWISPDPTLIESSLDAKEELINDFKYYDDPDNPDDMAHGVESSLLGISIRWIGVVP